MPKKHRRSTRTRKAKPKANRQGTWKSRVFPGLWIAGPALLARDSAKLIATVNQGIASPDHAAFVSLLTTVPLYMIYFVVQPMPGNVVVKQIIFDGTLNILLGLVVAFMYRGEYAPAKPSGM